MFNMIGYGATPCWEIIFLVVTTGTDWCHVIDDNDITQKLP